MAHNPEHRSDGALKQAVARALRPLVIGADAMRFAQQLPLSGSGIVTAEPGAGKTTGVPLALLAQDWLSDRVANGIVLVEPRRVAASQAAHRMAGLLGERVSSRDAGVVGLRMRGESKIGSCTRIEVVTDGVLARMLSTDPGFTGRSVVIFDEFHERSLGTDVGLALALSARALLRPDLVVVVMSATLEHVRVAELLGSSTGLPIERLAAPGRAFPVTRSHSTNGQDLVGRVEHAVVDAVSNHGDGDVLVFLPGIHEINQCTRRLRQHPALQHAVVLALHARGDAAETAAALQPATTGQQRIVLSTSLAQTSVTIEGVTTVIDAGLVRRQRRDPHTGLSRLITERVSLATATQRAGRAGRTAPGHAIALWSPAEQASFRATDPPEILDADLSGSLLTALQWGVHPTELAWVDPPSPDSWARAEAELLALSAIDETKTLTALGHRMAALGMQPRIGALLCTAEDDTAKTLANSLAAYFSESDWYVRDAPIDFRVRISELCSDQSEASSNLAAGAKQRFGRARSQLAMQLSVNQDAGRDRVDSRGLGSIGALMLQTFPERLASRVADLVDRNGQSSGDRFTFATGLTLPLAPGDAATVRGASLLVAIDVEGDRRRGTIRCGVPVSQAEVERWAQSSAFFQISRRMQTNWHGDRLTAVLETHVSSPIGDLLIGFATEVMAPEDVATAVLGRSDTEPFSFSETANELVARLHLAAVVYPDQFATPDNTYLAAAVNNWLLATVRAVSTFRWSDVNVEQALRHHLDSLGLGYRLNQVVPRTLDLGNDRTRSIRYSTDSGRPTIQVRLQDMFGQTSTPTVCDGREAITLELLSPANRVLAVTNDLHRFWQVGYPRVRSDLRGRYPKHQWPEDPASAAPYRMNNPRPHSAR